jgi:hypothetical protein
MKNLVLLLLLACVGGCSLVSLKSPNHPLSARDMNTRILTREYAGRFREAVEVSADDIIANGAEPGVADNALQWKSAAVGASQRAAMQIVPMMGLLDSWTFAVQMRAFVSAGGAGDELFGARQPAVVAVASGLANDAEALATKLVPPAQLDQARKFVAAYVQENPLGDLRMSRPSVVIAWNKGRSADRKLIESLGTVPEATADLAQRLQIYSDTTPSQIMWKTQLALRQSGYSGEDLRIALNRLDGRLDELSAAADAAPEHVSAAVRDVRRSMLDVVDRLNAASVSLIETLRTERIALSENVRTEREAVTVAVDAQRKALALDAAQIAGQVVKASGEQLRMIARDALLLLILLTLVLLSLPFAAGYFVGRARRERGNAV